MEKIAPTTLSRRITRATTVVSVRTHEAETNLRTIADGARDTEIIIIMAIEVAVETAIDR